MFVSSIHLSLLVLSMGEERYELRAGIKEMLVNVVTFPLKTDENSSASYFLVVMLTCFVVFAPLGCFLASSGMLLIKYRRIRKTPSNRSSATFLIQFIFHCATTCRAFVSDFFIFLFIITCIIAWKKKKKIGSASSSSWLLRMVGGEKKSHTNKREGKMTAAWRRIRTKFGVYSCSWRLCRVEHW